MLIRPILVLICFLSVLSAKVSFNDEIRPLLSNSCYRCHGPDEEDRKAKLRLDTREGATKGRDGFFAILPGKIEDSELIYRIVTDDEDEMMPPRVRGTDSRRNKSIFLSVGSGRERNMRFTGHIRSLKEPRFPRLMRP